MELSYGRNADGSCMAEGGSWSAGLSSSWSGSGVRGVGEEMQSIAVARRGVGRLMAAGVEEEPMIVHEENTQGGTPSAMAALSRCRMRC